MISCIFSDVSLLKAIESETGSLDDFAANEYAKIERDANLSSPPRGKTMLQTSHNITRACKILYGLVARLFSIEVNSKDPLVEAHQDIVLFDPERLFRFMLDVFKLKEKALRG